MMRISPLRKALADAVRGGGGGHYLRPFVPFPRYRKGWEPVSIDLFHNEIAQPQSLHTALAIHIRDNITEILYVPFMGHCSRSIKTILCIVPCLFTHIR
jgi:hypothetical protein